LSTPFFKFFYSFFDSFLFHKILRFPADFLCFLRTARAPAAGPFRVDKAAPARKPAFFSLMTFVHPYALKRTAAEDLPLRRFSFLLSSIDGKCRFLVIGGFVYFR
ncbi:MAG: hypothetical protein IKH12_07210, partial [Clostridia bacterium]|nr:hypothetical protein [Clostridia bacterium]